MDWWTNLTLPQALVICTALICFLRAEVGVQTKKREWKVGE